ncbi:hypothetical protein QCI_0942 [Clostridioides difficile CD44]|nr:hypothetical protein [Clostridioides difficile]EQE66384.1 hypothetical protein QCI_0942 [Clostridioides difficile CD44]
MWYVNVLENALPAFIPIRFYINYVVCKCTNARLAMINDARFILTMWT